MSGTVESMKRRPKKDHPSRKNNQQAGAELGQAQLKLGLDFTPIFSRFVFSGFSFYLIGLIEKIWFGILGSLHFKHFAM